MSAGGQFHIEQDESHLCIVWGVGLLFLRKDDRWVHVVQATRPPFLSRPLIVASHEWDEARDDPERVASPVFQELQLHRDADGRPHVLLLGMSGAHHFSADFLCEDRDGMSRIAVDVAERCRRADASFHASTYDVDLDSGQLAAADASTIAWDADAGRLTLAAGPSTSLAMAEAGRRATRVQALAEIGVVVATRRWQYSWSLAPYPA
jgi:hypothetical protein